MNNSTPAPPDTPDASHPSNPSDPPNASEVLSNAHDRIDELATMCDVLEVAIHQALDTVTIPITALTSITYRAQEALAAGGETNYRRTLGAILGIACHALAPTEPAPSDPSDTSNPSDPHPPGKENPTHAHQS